jgi:hypothetical protein
MDLREFQFTIPPRGVIASQAVFRASAWSFLRLHAFAVFLFIFEADFLARAMPSTRSYLPLAMLLGITECGILIYLLELRIETHASGIKYRNLLRGSFEVPFCKIQSVELHDLDFSRHNLARATLEIDYSGPAGDSQIRIPLHLFTSNAYVQICVLLNPKHCA